jgi:hypothetical protein
MGGRGVAKLTERIMVGVVLVAVTALAFCGRQWPFNSHPRDISLMPSPSVWNYLLADRVTLGVARLGVVFAILFFMASVVALGLAGRWMSGFKGLSVDEKEGGKESVTDLERRLKETETLLTDRARQRLEAENWAAQLIEELDTTRLELDQAKQDLEQARGDDD